MGNYDSLARMSPQPILGTREDKERFSVRDLQYEEARPVGSHASIRDIEERNPVLRFSAPSDTCVDEDEEYQLSHMYSETRRLPIGTQPEALPAPTSNVPYRHDAEHGFPTPLINRVGSALSGPGARVVALVGRAGVGYEYSHVLSSKTLNLLTRLQKDSFSHRLLLSCATEIT